MSGKMMGGAGATEAVNVANPMASEAPKGVRPLGSPELKLPSQPCWHVMELGPRSWWF